MLNGNETNNFENGFSILNPSFFIKIRPGNKKYIIITEMNNKKSESAIRFKKRNNIYIEITRTKRLLLIQVRIFIR